jgi:hypothetical protein
MGVSLSIEDPSFIQDRDLKHDCIFYYYEENRIGCIAKEIYDKIEYISSGSRFF